MIELTRTEGSDPLERYLLSINGVAVTNAHIFGFKRTDAKEVSAFASLYEYDDSEGLASHLFTELPSILEEVTLRLDFDWPESVDQVKIRRLLDHKDSFEIGFKFEFEYEDWKGPYSFAEYAKALSQVVDERNHLEIGWRAEDEESLANGFWIIFTGPSPQSSIVDEIARCSTTLKELTSAALETLNTQVSNDSLVVSFDFPNEIKVPCEQYLLYFVQFLKDLGVEATSNLEHQAGQVLFSVTPTNEKDALDKIRDTLDMYLRFPSSPISDITNEPIAIQRLEANILHLRSDLKLAAAELQAKNATIQAQQLTIGIQEGLLSGEIIFDSIRNVSPKAEDKEPLLGGLLRFLH